MQGCNFLILSLALGIEITKTTSFDHCVGNHENVCTAPSTTERYLLYTVNPGEGFNLARDVFLRAAVLVNALNKNESWTLEAGLLFFLRLEIRTGATISMSLLTPFSTSRR